MIQTRSVRRIITLMTFVAATAMRRIQLPCFIQPADVLMSMGSLYTRLEPNLSLANVAEELLVEAIDQTVERSEPVWSIDCSPDLVGQPPADELEPPTQVGQARYGTYRLIDWLTATGFLVASLAIAFVVHRNLF